MSNISPIKLIFLNGTLKGTKIRIDREASIGRSEKSTLRVPDSSISANHAVIYFENDKPFVKDLQSTNGTRINKEKITVAELHDGDRLRFGEIQVHVEIPAEKKKTENLTPPSVTKQVEKPHSPREEMPPSAVPRDMTLPPDTYR